MKKILISIPTVIVLLLIALVWFLKWASEPVMSKENYDYLYPDHGKGLILPDTMSVMSYNVGYMSGMTNNLSIQRDYDFFKNNLNKTVALFDKYRPNIIGLQEVDIVADRSFYQNQLDTIIIRNHYRTAFRSINWDKRYVPFPYWPPSNHFGPLVSGQAIVSDLLIHHGRRTELMRPDHPFYYDAFYISRLIQLSDIILKDQEIRVLNVHLEAFDKKTRIQQAETIKLIYERYSERMPIILMGDFNSVPPWEGGDSDAMEIIFGCKHIRSAIDSTEYVSNPEMYYTYSSREPSRKIDYIFYNENFIRKIEAKVVHEAGEISDHLPVFMKFEIYGKLDIPMPF